MAKAIAPTPTLKGKDTKSSLEEMKRPNNKKENQIKQRINNSRHVDFFLNFNIVLFESFTIKSLLVYS